MVRKASRVARIGAVWLLGSVFVAAGVLKAAAPWRSSGT